jgi:hypothetical protein
MAKGDVYLKGTGDFKDVQKKLNKMHKELAKMRGELGKTATASKKATKEEKELARAAKAVYDKTRTPAERYNKQLAEMKRLLKAGKINQDTYRRGVAMTNRELRAAEGHTSRLGASIASMATRYLSAAGAIGTFVASIRDLEERERRAREITVTPAQRQAGMINMLGDVTPAQAQAFLSKIDELVTKVKPVGGKETAYAVLETTLSAAGNQRLAMRAAEIGMRLGRKSTEEAVAIAGGLLDIAQITGETKDMLKNAGFLVAATTQARVTEMQAMAKYGAPAAMGVMTRGGAPREAMALFTALSKGMVDPEGRRARTAAISLSEALAKFLPAKDVYDVQGGRRRRVTKGTRLVSARQRLEYLWEHPEARERFEREYVENMEKQAIGAAKAIIKGPKETLVSRQYLEAIKKIPPAAEARPLAERKIAALQAPFAQKVAAGGRAFDVAGERLTTETKAGREAAIAGVYSKAELSELLSRAQVGWGKRQAQLGAYMLRRWPGGQDPQQAFEAVINQRIQGLVGGPGAARAVGFGAGLAPAARPTVDERKIAEILRDGLNDATKELAEKLDTIATNQHQQMNRQSQDNRRRPFPVAPEQHQ